MQVRSSVLVITLLATVGSSRPPAAAEELVANGRFAATAGEELPTPWRLEEPAVENARCAVQATSDGLRVKTLKEPYGVAVVWQDLSRIQAGKSYAVKVAAIGQRLPSPYRNVLVRLTWTKQGKPLEDGGPGLLMRGPSLDGEGLLFEDALAAPAGSDGARLSLEVKWPRGGTVVWRSASVRPAPAPKPRPVKIGTVYLKPSRSTPEKNLQLFSDQIDAAGKLKLDIVCLPEAILMIGTGRSAAQCAEPIPGPSTRHLGEVARRNRLWVVAGLYEQDGARVYNTAVLLDREGRLAGKYRKIHLPREEWKQGVTPGSEYPVFRTDFGNVAIQICYDWFFPEIDTILAMRGAEIVFAPTWGTTFADRGGRVEGENVFRVRARDNGIFLVPSVYDGSSLVIDPLGRVLASNRGQSGLFWTEVDLGQRESLWWVGHWRSIGPRDRMPETYRDLLGDPRGP